MEVAYLQILIHYPFCKLYIMWDLSRYPLPHFADNRATTLESYKVSCCGHGVSSQQQTAAQGKHQGKD